MRSLRMLVVAAAAAATALVSTAAWSDGGRRGFHRHHHHHHTHGSRLHLGFVFGGPLWYPPPVYSYPYPYVYAYPPAIVVPPAPRVYIERDDRVARESRDPGYWYYCRESETYYPYVKECAGPWERVPARPESR